MSRKPSATKDQEAIIRQFILGCDMYAIPILPEYYASLIGMLGYKFAPNGARVHEDVDLKYAFGTPDVFADTYDMDGVEFTNAEITDNTYTLDTSPSQSPKGDKVGSVLRKKV